MNYRGFKLDCRGGYIYVYNSAGTCVWTEHRDWDGENGWRKCRQWVDEFHRLFSESWI